MKKKYIPRPFYVSKAISFINSNLIKVFTGQRRTGKSYLMLQMMDEIKKRDHQAEILFVDKEIIDFDFIQTAKDLTEYVKKNLVNGKNNFLFIDEVQEINQFEKALRSLLNEGLVDIWCSGSNADLLSGELTDKLSGRYIEFRVHTLSYIEFLEFHKLEDSKDSLMRFMKYGGLPNLINLPDDEEVIFDYLNNINSTILLKDVVRRHQIRNVVMLENLIRFLADNTGSLFSSASISRLLKSQGQKISPSIITNYISYILNSFYLVKVLRSDLQGKKIFEVNEKYYFEDLGLRNAWLGYQPMHINKMIENLVFNHLHVMGFKITVGNVGDKEVDFIAENKDFKIYVQCAYLLSDQKVIDREFGSLLLINDNHPKIVVTMDEPSGGNIEGIEHMHLRTFLKKEF